MTSSGFDFDTLIESLLKRAGEKADSPWELASEVAAQFYRLLPFQGRKVFLDTFYLRDIYKIMVGPSLNRANGFSNPLDKLLIVQAYNEIREGAGFGADLNGNYQSIAWVRAACVARARQEEIEASFEAAFENELPAFFSYNGRSEL